MPIPATTALPKPKSWDEFEDMCVDLLKRLWRTPYIFRNGRSGQQQDGVDIYGQPEHLGGSTSQKYAGGQCKLTERLSLGTLQAEVEQAKSFVPALSEYLIFTTAHRDAALQIKVRTTKWPFPVFIWFWEDVSLELSSHGDLLQKYYPAWMKKTTTKDHVIDFVRASTPEDFEYDDQTGVFLHTKDVQLRIILDRTNASKQRFDEPWVHKFPDPVARQQFVYIDYGNSRIVDYFFVHVDGFRYILPLPHSREQLWITPFQYHLGRILNHPKYGYDFDSGLRRAGITVRDEATEPETII